MCEILITQISRDDTTMITKRWKNFTILIHVIVSTRDIFSHKSMFTENNNLELRIEIKWSLNMRVKEHRNRLNQCLGFSAARRSSIQSINLIVNHLAALLVVSAGSDYVGGRSWCKGSEWIYIWIYNTYEIRKRKRETERWEGEREKETLARTH